MAVRMAVYYKQPDDPDVFEKRYVEEHLPLAKQYPNIKTTTFFKVSRKLVGDFPYAFAFIGMWESMDDFKAAMKSEINAEVAAHAKSLGTDMDVVMLDGVDIWGM